MPSSARYATIVGSVVTISSAQCDFSFLRENETVDLTRPAIMQFSASHGKWDPESLIREYPDVMLGVGHPDYVLVGYGTLEERLTIPEFMAQLPFQGKHNYSVTVQTDGFNSTGWLARFNQITNLSRQETSSNQGKDVTRKMASFNSSTWELECIDGSIRENHAGQQILPQASLADMRSWKIFATVLAITIMLLSYSCFSRCFVSLKSEGSMEASGQQRVVLNSIEGLRALCTAYVLAVHLCRGGQMIVDPKVLPWICGKGAASIMQFFFIASGFVTYLAKCHSIKRFTFKQSILFVLQRFARFAPAYYFSLVLSVSIDANDNCCYQIGPINAIFAQTVWPRNFYDCGQVLDWRPSEVAWFVSTLMICSLAFPIACVALPDGPGSLLSLLVVTVTGRSFIPRTSFAWYQSPVLRFIEVLAGMLSAKICCLFRGSSLLGYNVWGMVFDVSAVMSLVIVSQCQHEEFPERSDYYLTGPICLCCVAAYAKADQLCRGEVSSVRLLGACLSWFPLTSWAKHSYSIYIMTIPMRGLVSVLFQRFNQNSLWVHFVAFLVMQSCGVLTSIVVQRPLQRMLELPFQMVEVSASAGSSQQI